MCASTSVCLCGYVCTWVPDCILNILIDCNLHNKKKEKCEKRERKNIKNNRRGFVNITVKLSAGSLEVGYFVYVVFKNVSKQKEK